MYYRLSGHMLLRSYAAAPIISPFIFTFLNITDPLQSSPFKKLLILFFLSRRVLSSFSLSSVLHPKGFFFPLREAINLFIVHSVSTFYFLHIYISKPSFNPIPTSTHSPRVTRTNILAIRIERSTQIAFHPISRFTLLQNSLFIQAILHFTPRFRVVIVFTYLSFSICYILLSPIMSAKFSFTFSRANSHNTVFRIFTFIPSFLHSASR